MTSLVFAASTLLWPALVAAPGGQQDPFARFDKDGDGKISKDEAPPRMKENFARIDTNDDGYISREELRAAIRKRRKNRREHPPGTPPGPH